MSPSGQRMLFLGKGSLEMLQGVTMEVEGEGKERCVLFAS